MLLCHQVHPSVSFGTFKIWVQYILLLLGSGATNIVFELNVFCGFLPTFYSFFCVVDV